jgi:hypothetical protein
MGESRQPDPEMRNARFENRGVSATADKFKICRRSAPAIVQLPRPERRLLGSM